MSSSTQKPDPSKVEPKVDQTAALKVTDGAQSYKLQIYSTLTDFKASKLKVAPTTTVKQVRLLLPKYSDYNFYFEDQPFLNQYAPIKDIAKNGVIILKINNIQQLTQNDKLQKQVKGSLQDMTLIKKSDRGQKSTIVRGSLKQKLSEFRAKLSIPTNFQFVKAGEIITNEVQEDYLIQYVSQKSKNESDKKPIVKMIKPLTEAQQDKNLQKQIAKQEKAQKQAKQIIQNLDKLQKGMIDKTKFQATKKEIQNKLKQYNVPLKLDISEKEGFEAAKKVFENQVKTAQGWLNLAKTVDPKQTFPVKLQKNGYILAPYYSNQHLSKIHQLRVVDFSKTNIQYLQNLERSKVLNIAMYDKVVKSNARTEIDKLDNYKFIGASVGAGYGPVSASVEVGHAQISSNQTIKCKKSVQQGQSITQIFYALCINHAITFLPGDIKLKQQVVQNFQLLIQNYLKKKKSLGSNDKEKLLSLEQEVRQNINAFLNKYGDGVQNGIYFLGGVYKNTMNYVFRAQKTTQELQKIMSNQTKNSVKASVSGGVGAFSAKVGVQVKDESATSKAQKQFQQNANSGYTCTKSHQSYPLNYVQNLNDWLALIQGQRFHWKLIKIQQKESIPMKQLLNKPINQTNTYNMIDQFVQARREVFEFMETLQNRDYFKFALESTHPNMAVDEKKNFDQNKSKIYVDKTNIGLYQKTDDFYTSVCGDTPFYKNKVHNIQASIDKGKNMNIIFGVVSGNQKKHLQKFQDYKSEQAECIYYSFNQNQIFYGNCNQSDKTKRSNFCNCKPQYKLNDLINMSVDLIQFTVSFTLNRIHIGTYDIPLIFLKNGLYPFFGFGNQNVILNLSRNLLQFENKQ